MLKLKFVCFIAPVIVHYVSDKSKSPKRAGVCFGPYIRIKESYIEDIGLLQHELEHSRQTVRTVGLNFILYRFKKWRYKFELQAYKLQLTYVDESQRNRYAWLFADFIANTYNLNVDQYTPYKELLKGLKYDEA